MFNRVVETTPKAADVGLLVIRVWFGLVLALAHGQSKLVGLDEFIGKVAGHGFPVPWFSGTFAAMSEFLGGLALALGVLTRPAAACILLTMLGAAFVVHADDAFRKQEFALAFGMAALAILIAGPGRFSLDARWARREGR